MSPLRHDLLILEIVRNSPDATTATTAYTGNQKWDTSGIRNGTPGSLPILGRSTSNKDRFVALLKPSLHAYGETIAFRFRRVRAVFSACPICIRNGTVAPEMGHLRLTSSVYGGQASNFHKR